MLIVVVAVTLDVVVRVVVEAAVTLDVVVGTVVVIEDAVTLDVVVVVRGTAKIIFNLF